MKHTFRNPELVQVHPIRNLLRGQHPQFPMPSGSDGLVINDLDLVLKWHGKALGEPAGQRTRLVEIKHDKKEMGYGQLLQWADIDYQLSRRPDRYDGFFVVNYDHSQTKLIEVGQDILEFPDDVTFTVTGSVTREMTNDQFTQWVINPYSPFAGMGATKAFKQAVRKLYGPKSTRRSEVLERIDEIKWLYDFTDQDIYDAVDHLFWKDRIFGAAS